MNKKFTEEERLNAVKLYEDGYTVKEVENLTGISSEYVKNLLKKHGVIARPAGFQNGNSGRAGKTHSQETKDKISKKHKSSGHKPSLEAIKNGQSKSLKVRSEQKDSIGNLIKSYQQGAANRNLQFDLCREDFEFFIFQNCYYCDAEPSLRIVNHSPFICNGIDRIDNSLGYFKENCVACCKICNVMKSSRNRNDFINHCLKIAKRFKDE